MASQLQPIQLDYIGINGITNNRAFADKSTSYLTECENFILNRKGVLESRKGVYVRSDAYNSSLEAPEHIFEHIDVNGDSDVITYYSVGYHSYNNNTTNAFSIGTGNTISSYNMNGVSYLISSAGDMYKYDGDMSKYTSAVLSDKGATFIEDGGVTCASAIFGRAWVGKGQIVYWSDLLIPDVFNTGSAGYINFNTVVGSSAGEIVAIVENNNLLYFMFENAIAVYQGGKEPETMSVYDIIKGAGCLSKNTVQHVNGDVWFLSSQGVVSLNRLVSEKVIPLSLITANTPLNRIDTSVRKTNPTALYSFYNKKEGLYFVRYNADGANIVVNTTTKTQDGLYFVSTFSSVGNGRPYFTGSTTLFLTDKNDVTFCANRVTGVYGLFDHLLYGIDGGFYVYEDYCDTSSGSEPVALTQNNVSCLFNTGYLNFDAYAKLKFFKKIHFIYETEENDYLNPTIGFISVSDDTQNAIYFRFDGFSVVRGAYQHIIEDIYNGYGSGNNFSIRVALQTNGKKLTFERMVFYITVGRFF
jgi:hypothetical protein